MARLFTSGCEYGPALAQVGVDVGTNSGTSSRDASIFRTGAASIKCDSTAGNTVSNVQIPAAAHGCTTRMIFRGYFRVTALPSSNVAIIATSVTNFKIMLSSTGSLFCQYNAANNMSSLGTLSINTWYRIEFDLTVGVGAVDAISTRLDGGTPVTVTNVETGLSTLSADPVLLGWNITAPGASKVINIDDIAINDASGTQQNSWPGEGKVYLLKPNLDIARNAAWFAGAAGTTNLWDAVNNTPPVGVAEASATTTTQLLGNATAFPANIDLAFETYVEKGIATPLDLVASFLNAGGSVSSVGVGNNAAQTRYAQRFVGGGFAFDLLDIYLSKTNAPTDNLIIEVQTESGGLPSGTVVATLATIPGASLTTVQEEMRYPINFTPTLGTAYWIVLRRSGANDASNFFIVGYTGISTTFAGIISGSLGTSKFDSGAGTWGARATGTQLFLALFPAVAVEVAVVQYVMSDAEGATTTGTKAGSITGLADPAISATTFNYGDDVGAGGTHPTNWKWHKTAFAYDQLVKAAPRARASITSGSTGTRKVMVEAVGAYVDVAPAQLYTETGTPTLTLTPTNVQNLTVSGNEITDASRALGVQGDGR